MSFARTYLRIAGVFTLVFGVWYLLAPGFLLDAAGFEPVAPAGRTDVRATYGGFQLGLGAFLLWAAAEESRVRTALVLVVLSIGAVGLSRSVGLVLDGSPNPFHVAGLTTEISLTLLTVYAIRRAGEPGAAATS